MKIVDRYLIRQLIPVWVWCMLVFVLLSCLVDLFQHLDEIMRYQIPAALVLKYYLSFMPLVFVQASPLGVLLAAAFVAMRLVRYQELLAMNAGGISPAQACAPFLFVGWAIGLGVFAVSDQILPKTNVVYEQLRMEAFRAGQDEQRLESVATIDEQNRLYHARVLDVAARRVEELTVLEHGPDNRPQRTVYARRAIYSVEGWDLFEGTVTELGPGGELAGEPDPFAERRFSFPATLESFQQPTTQPQALSMSGLRRLIARFRKIGITNVRRYELELASRLSIPVTSVIICLIGFIGSTRRYTRGQLKGLGTSLAWGMAYYLFVAAGLGTGKQGMVPVAAAVWGPHLVALWLCLRELAGPPPKSKALPSSVQPAPGPHAAG